MIRFAQDIKPDADVEILNPDQVICHLGPDGALNMELTIDHGRGYVPAEKNKNPAMPIGTIPVDSIFTPVLKVNYSVENTRVGNQTDFDKLTIEGRNAGRTAGQKLCRSGQARPR